MVTMGYVLLWYQWEMRYHGINRTFYIMISMGHVTSWYQWDMRYHGINWKLYNVIDGTCENMVSMRHMLSW